MSTIADNKEQILGTITRYVEAHTKRASNVNIELELRFKNIDRAAFTGIYTAITSPDSEFINPVLDCSVNVISADVVERGKKHPSQEIYRVQYGVGAPVRSYWKKSKLTYPIRVGEILPYTLNVSSEEEIDPVPISPTSVVRFKNRISFTYLDVWRMDLTAVKAASFDDVKNDLALLREQLCTGTKNIKHWLRDINFGLINSLEVELEHIGDPALFSIRDLDVTTKVMTMMNPAAAIELIYRNELLSIAKYLYQPKTVSSIFAKSDVKIRQILNKAIALNKAVYQTKVYPTIGYFLTDKADGERAIVCINGNRVRILFESSMIEVIGASPTTDQNAVTIADCEYVHDTLYVFDVLVYLSTSLASNSFADRHAFLSKAVHAINSALANAVLTTHSHVGVGAQPSDVPTKSPTKITCKSKEYTQITPTNLQDAVTSTYSKKREYEVDGLIFTSSNEEYLNTHNYKWKPRHNNTIDFLATKCPNTLLGIAPYLNKPDHTLYLLFCGIDRKTQHELGIGLMKDYNKIFHDDLRNIPTDGQYFPIQFSSTAYPLAYIYHHVTTSTSQDLSGKIIELSRNTDNTEWIFHRVRDDRTASQKDFGNDFKVAELTFINYIDHFDLENLWGGTGDYFAKPSAPKSIHKAQKRYMRFVISLVLKKLFISNKYVIDLATGRGADLHRFEEIGVEHLLCTDADPGAIAELVRRRFEFVKYKKAIAVKTGGTSNEADPNFGLDYEQLFVKSIRAMTVHATVVDLKTPHEQLAIVASKFGMHVGVVNGMVCNFAFHYLCDNVTNLRNILKYISTSLVANGRFMFSVMDGQKIFALIKNIVPGQQWQSRENGVIKYAIRKDYTNDTFVHTGQMISVLLPFSDEMYSEPLCNVDYVINEAKKLNLACVLDGGFADHLSLFAKTNKSTYDDLTTEDKSYIGLFRYVVLEKQTRAIITARDKLGSVTETSAL